MKHDERWESRLEELREFKREHGHCDVPQRLPGGLGLWVMTQRRYRKQGSESLDARRIQKLEDEGFRWVVEVPNEERWNVRLEELREFKREHGHCNVPDKHPGGLGRWVRNQRMAHKQGKRSLDARRIRLLEDEGFRWVIQDERLDEERWDARLRELREFKREYGHCDVPMKHPGGLGLWVMIQRRARKQSRKSLDSYRIQKLEDEGFRWVVRNKMERVMAGSGLARAGQATPEKGGDSRSHPLEEPKAPSKEASEQEGFTLARQRKLDRRPSEIASEHKVVHQEDGESASNLYEGRPGVMRDAVEGLKSTLDKYEGRLEPLQEKLLREELKSAQEEMAESTLAIL